MALEEEKRKPLNLQADFLDAIDAAPEDYSHVKPVIIAEPEPEDDWFKDEFEVPVLGATNDIEK